MNRANYTDRVQRKFPLSTEGLDFIQMQIMLAAEYAQTAGGNYILSGCTVSGGRAAAGIMVINGEILTFAGGDLQDKVRIVEATEAIMAEGSNYPDAYVRRYVEFGQNLGNVDTFNWADLTAFPTNKFLLENSATKAEMEALKSLTMPKGAIIMWSGSTIFLPAGFALCNGQTVDGFGAVPDLRGRFIVGHDADKSSMPENDTTRTENYGKVGNKGGLREVALSVAQIPRHTHTFNGRVVVTSRDNADATGGKVAEASGAVRATMQSPNEVGDDQAHENRPPYYVLAFIIKVV